MPCPPSSRRRRFPLALLALACLGSAESSDLNNRGVLMAQAGRFEEAIALLRQAAAKDTSDPAARKNLSGILTDWAVRLQERGRDADAISALEEATGYDPLNGIAWVMLGDLRYFRRDDPEAAIRAWREAHDKVDPATWQSVGNRLTTAQRDQLIERGFSAKESRHFAIRFQERRDVDVETLARLLETSYAALAQALGGGPSKLTVIVYTGADLRRVHGQRDWALGFYDGRIRLLVEELGEAALADMVAHELTHAFLQHRYGSRVPIWVHEGYAQLQEPGQPGNAEERIEEGIRSRAMWVPLKWLDQKFARPSSHDDVARAYAEARVAVESLVAKHGMGRFRTFLAALGKGQPVGAAFDVAFTPSRWARADLGNFD